MAFIDAEADEIIRTLRETNLFWLGELGAETIANMEEVPRETPEQRVYAAHRQLEEIRRAIVAVIKQEREFNAELMAIAPKLDIQSVVLETPEGETVELMSQTRPAILARFVAVLNEEIEVSLRSVRLREGFAE